MGELFHRLRELVVLPFQFLSLGHEFAFAVLDFLVPLPHLAFFPGHLAVPRGQFLGDLLHALGRPGEFVPAILQRRPLAVERFLAFRESRDFGRDLRLPAFQVLRTGLDRLFPLGDRFLAGGNGVIVLSQSGLPLATRLLSEDQLALPAFGIGESGVEDFACSGDLLRFRLEARIQIVHLPALPLEGFLSRRDRRLPIGEGRLPSREIPFEVLRLRGPLRQVPPLDLQLRAGLLRFHREHFSLGLDLDILGGPAFLEAPHDHAARLLHGLQLRSEGFEFLLTDAAPLVLLLQLPLPFVQLLLAVHELLFLFSTGVEVPEVCVPFRGLLDQDLREDLVRIAEALHGRLGIAALQLVDADRGMAVVVGTDFELRPFARGVFQDLGDRRRARDVDLGPVFRQDAIPAAEDEDALGGGVTPEHGRLEEPVEFHRPQFRQNGANRLFPAIRDSFHSARRYFHHP